MYKAQELRDHLDIRINDVESVLFSHAVVQSWPDPGLKRVKSESKSAKNSISDCNDSATLFARMTHRIRPQLRSHPIKDSDRHARAIDSAPNPIVA